MVDGKVAEAVGMKESCDRSCMYLCGSGGQANPRIRNVHVTLGSGSQVADLAQELTLSIYKNFIKSLTKKTGVC